MRKQTEVRKRYRESQEDQLSALGLVVSAVVLWTTRHQQAALNVLRAEGAEVHDDDDLHLMLLLDAALASCARRFLARVHRMLDENGDDAYTQAIETVLDHVRSVRRVFGSPLLAPESDED